MLLVGPPVEALREWLSGPTSRRGRSFGRSTDGKPWRRRRSRCSPSAVVKRGCDMAGREAEAFFAPGLRDGYLTGAARQGIGLPEAMQQSQHRSVQMPRATTPKPNAPRGGRQGWRSESPRRAIEKPSGAVTPTTTRVRLVAEMPYEDLVRLLVGANRCPKNRGTDGF